MNYYRLASEDVKVFPAAFRNWDAQSKLTSEENLTGILRNATTDTYIINSDGTEFSIHGYYFKLAGFPAEIMALDDVWATIILDPDGRLAVWNPLREDPSYDFDVVEGGAYIFNGLYLVDYPIQDYTFTDEIGEKYYRYTLQLKKDGQINAEKKIRFLNEQMPVIQPNKGGSGKTSLLESANTYLGELPNQDPSAEVGDLVDSNRFVLFREGYNFVKWKLGDLWEFINNHIKNIDILVARKLKITDHDINFEGDGNIISGGNINVTAGNTTFSGTVITSEVKAASGDSHLVGYADKLGTDNIGSATQPMYLVNGVATPTTSTVGSGVKPIYLNNGEITASGSNVGGYGSGTYQSAYMSSGSITDGQTIHYSTSKPSGNGKTGDLWFVYK